MKTKILMLLSVLLLITGCSNGDEQVKTNAQHVPVVIQSSDGNETITYNAEEFSNADWLYENFFGDYNFPDSFKYPMMIEMQKLANGFALKFAKAKTTDEMVSEYSKFYALKQSVQFQKFHSQTVTHFSAMSADELADKEEAWQEAVEAKANAMKEAMIQVQNDIILVDTEEIDSDIDLSNDTNVQEIDITDEEPTEDELKQRLIVSGEGYELEEEKISEDVADTNTRETLETLIEKDTQQIEAQKEAVQEYDLPYDVPSQSEKIASIDTLAQSIAMSSDGQDTQKYNYTKNDFNTSSEFQTGDVLLLYGFAGTGHVGMVSKEKNKDGKYENFVIDVTPQKYEGYNISLQVNDEGNLINALQKTKLADFIKYQPFAFLFRPSAVKTEQYIKYYKTVTQTTKYSFLGWVYKTVVKTYKTPVYGLKSYELITDTIKNNACNYMSSQFDDTTTYNLFTPRGETKTTQYCSQAIWHAYIDQDIDIEEYLDPNKLLNHQLQYAVLIAATVWWNPAAAITFGSLAAADLAFYFTDAYFVTPMEITKRGRKIYYVNYFKSTNPDGMEDVGYWDPFQDY